ncbi:MAG: hypothetical protein EBZ87_06660 [Microbacteriaceae bacterium]|nr:hypothetical protein [Microbacteriaceae bacterium]
MTQITKAIRIDKDAKGRSKARIVWRYGNAEFDRKSDALRHALAADLITDEAAAQLDALLNGSQKAGA